jgi:hypothetical protein
MSYPLEDFKLYHLTNDDRKLLDELNISLDISYVLKFSNMTFSEAITIPFTGDIYKDMSPILLINIPRRSNFYSSVTQIIYGFGNNYKKIISLNNVDEYHIFILRNKCDECKCYRIVWEYEINTVLLEQLHSEVTKVYQHIFHVQEICKIYNICDDIKKYIIKFIL